MYYIKYSVERTRKRTRSIVNHKTNTFAFGARKLGRREVESNQDRIRRFREFGFEVLEPNTSSSAYVSDRQRD